MQLEALRRQRENDPWASYRQEREDLEKARREVMDVWFRRGCETGRLGYQT
jgi:hypothetical protein